MAVLINFSDEAIKEQWKNDLYQNDKTFHSTRTTELTVACFLPNKEINCNPTMSQET